MGDVIQFPNRWREKTQSDHILGSVKEACAALRMDKLECVYFRGGEVFVATAFGRGVFPNGRWYVNGGPGPSVKKETT